MFILPTPGVNNKGFSIFRSLKAAKEFAEQTGTEIPCECQHWGSLDIGMGGHGADGTFSWHIILQEQIRCLHSAYELDGWEVWNWMAAPFQSVSWQFAKKCEDCTKKPCGGTFDWPAFEINGKSTAKQAPAPISLLLELSINNDEFTLTDIELDTLLTSTLDYLDSVGVDDPEKKKCREVEKWCKKGGGDPPRK